MQSAWPSVLPSDRMLVARRCRLKWRKHIGIRHKTRKMFSSILSWSLSCPSFDPCPDRVPINKDVTVTFLLNEAAPLNLPGFNSEYFIIRTLVRVVTKWAVLDGFRVQKQLDCTPATYIWKLWCVTLEGETKHSISRVFHQRVDWIIRQNFKFRSPVVVYQCQ